MSSARSNAAARNRRAGDPPGQPVQMQQQGRQGMGQGQQGQCQQQGPGQ